MTDEPALPPQVERIRTLLERAIVELRGTHTFGDVIEAMLSGRLQLFVGERCFALTEFTNYPRMRVLNVFLAGGDIREAKKLQPGVEAFARGGGASRIEFLGKASRQMRKRLGWAAMTDGIDGAWIHMRKDITP